MVGRFGCFGWLVCSLVPLFVLFSCLFVWVVGLVGSVGWLVGCFDCFGWLVVLICLLVSLDVMVGFLDWLL